VGEVILRHLTKHFGSVVAVDDVSIRVEDGEFVVLLGPSGCGKSTILRLIAGLEDATSGEIAIGGKLVNFVDPVKRNVAMVFQNYALYPHMTVRKNIGFPLEMAKKGKTEIGAAIERAAEILELGGLLGRFPDQLSGGQRQRVARARAIVRAPEAFRLVEPLSNLDALPRVQTRAELMRLHQRLATTTLYVTHDQVEAMTMGQRIAVLRDGVLQQLGTPDDVYNRPANSFVATFIGAPAMNLLAGRLALENGTCRFTGSGFEVALDRDALGLGEGVAPPADVRLGIRPETLRLTSGGEGTIPGTVRLLEPVGSDLYLEVETPGGSVQVRTAPDTRVQVDERVSLGFDVSRSHLFGADGRSLRYGADAPASTPAEPDDAAATGETGAGAG
jgi:ABC-type sugar transport system ATPase subunit